MLKDASQLTAETEANFVLGDVVMSPISTKWHFNISSVENFDVIFRGLQKQLRVYSDTCDYSSHEVNQKASGSPTMSMK